MPLQFSPFHIRNALCSNERLVKELVSHFVADAILQIPFLLGHLDVLGNPSRIIQSAGKGLSDLFLLPGKAITKGPILFIENLGLGVVSLFRNVSQGALLSISGLSNSLAQNLSSKNSREVNSLGMRSSFSRGVNSLANGMFTGMVGIVERPVSGASRSGVWGFVKGTGEGLVGAFLKPVGGVMGFISETSNGLASLTASSPTRNEPRKIHIYNQMDNVMLDRISSLKLRLFSMVQDESFQAKFSCIVVHIQSHECIIFCTNKGVRILGLSDNLSILPIDYVNMTLCTKPGDLKMVFMNSLPVEFVSSSMRRNFLEFLYLKGIKDDND